MSTTTTTPKMPYRLLGRSGLKVSALSYGSWVTFKTQIDAKPAYALMKRAYEAGVNFFDNAEVYANGDAERVMGEAYRMGLEEGVWTREDLVISTKIFFGAGRTGPNLQGLSRKHVIEGTRASLKRLGLEYVDLIFCHRPDPLTPLEETVRAFNFLIEQGLAFYWGTSEWSAKQITEATQIALRLNLIPPLMDQPQYNMFERHRVEHEYSTLYRDYGLGTTIWSPLASGILTGKYSGKNFPEGSRLALPEYEWLRKRKEAQDDQFTKSDELLPIAKELGCTLAQLAIAWCVSNKNVSTVILGATSIQQLEDNLNSLAIVDKLTPAVIERIELVLKNKPVNDGIEAQVNGLRNLL